MEIAELVEFLEANANKNIEHNPIHARLLNTITDRLDSFGIECPARVYREVQLIGYDKRRGGIIDLAVLSRSNELCLIEATVLRSKEQRALRDVRKKFRDQLQPAYGYFMNKFGIPSKLIGIYRVQPSNKLHTYNVFPTREYHGSRLQRR